METSFTRYIWKHTSRQQLWILLIVLVSMVPYYLAFDLPKMLINGPITGTGFDSPDATQSFLPGTPFASLELDRMQTLVGLSLAFLGLVIINGLFKYYINTYKGLMGERLLRRVRFELIDRILRFLPGEFKHVKGGEISSMVKDEVEPMGGFTSEAFVQPVLLSGRALTALGFIFVQHFWLGLVALVMASVQMIFIPRLRKRLLVLGRQRQIGARQLAGKVTEIVEGIETIHVNDTSNYERADVATRLGNLFRIRFEIYSRKYKIKFLNNFLAQVTPFVFYLVGGYLAITGRLDVGQLVAVITAYKELPGPLKELIDWDMARQDVQVKYEQIVNQFDTRELIHPDSQAFSEAAVPYLGFPLNASNITTEDESGSTTLEHVSIAIESGQKIAVTGDAYSGANVLAEVFGGISQPVKGKIVAGKDNLATLPEHVTGRRISYASSDTFFFSASLEDNLLYGLKNRPWSEVEYSDEAAKIREWELAEAKRTGNPVFDLNSSWINTDSVNGLDDSEELIDAIRTIIEAVQLSDDVFDFALYSKVDLQRHGTLAEQVVTLRRDVRASLDEKGLGDLVVPFDMDTYNDQANILENILFGVLTSQGESNSDGIDYFRKILKQSGLDELLFKMGLAIAESSPEFFQDLPDDHPFFDRMDLLDASDIPNFRLLYGRTKNTDFDNVPLDDQYAWINLSFMYSEPHHCSGVLDAELKRKIIETRTLLHHDMPDELRGGIEVYDSESYLTEANLVDNIVFGKVDRSIEDVLQQLRNVVRPFFEQQPELYMSVYRVGLDYNVGPAGRRLTAAQRQKLNLARVLMRKSDFYIFNRPISGLDQTQQAQITENTLWLLEQSDAQPAVLWVLASAENARQFDRCITLKDKTIVEDRVFDSTNT